MKKYHITDADGCRYDVEEEIVDELPEENVEQPEMHDALSEEEISALKGLAAIAPKLMALVAEEVEDDIKVEADEDEDVEIDANEEDDEEVIDTDCENKPKTHDSKKSFGAIEKKRERVDDSLTDDIATAWAKRYGGIK